MSICGIQCFSKQMCIHICAQTCGVSMCVCRSTLIRCTHVLGCREVTESQGSRAEGTGTGRNQRGLDVREM